MLSFLGYDHIRYAKSRYFRYLAQTVYVVPLLIGLASAYLFAVVPQMQEVYLGIIEDKDVWRGFGGLLALSLFSSLLYAWNHTTVTGRIDAIYPDHADLEFDRGILSVRDLKTMFTASLPFLGLAWGLFEVYAHAGQATALIKSVSNTVGNVLERQAELSERLASLPVVTAISLAAVVVTDLVLLFVLHRFRYKKHLLGRILQFSYALTIILILVPILAPSLTLKASRLAGPLAGTAFVLIAGTVTIRILLWLLQNAARLLLTLPSVLMMSAGWLPLWLRQMLVAVIPIAFVGALGAKIILSGKPDKADLKSTLAELHNRKDRNNALRADLAAKFRSWIIARNFEPGRRHHIFIVTAQGGGIYATSSAAFFLATLQDHCPAFAKHIFAVSAVSGGSVGASLFEAALAETPPKDQAACDFSNPETLTERLRSVTQADHLSPLLAYLLPDLLRGALPEGARSRFDTPTPYKTCSDNSSFQWLSRDQALERSFISSFERSRLAPVSGNSDACLDRRDLPGLRARYQHVWSASGNLPALLLNATWVETGYRVAFSPFPLQPIGRGTLYSFDDLHGLLDLRQGGTQDSNGWENPSLIGAAIVSARFPVVMPPWINKASSNNRWTFVDGGYADSSGAATGLELYKALKTELSALGWEPELRNARGDLIDASKIDLHLIVLTDALVEPDFKKISAGVFDDFISPINTVLTVRELLARRAVTQAYDELGSDLIIMQLDQKTFPLALGWKLSNLSSDIIRFMMGSPLGNLTSTESANWATRIVIHNSCELRRIAELLAETSDGPDSSQCAL